MSEPDPRPVPRLAAPPHARITVPGSKSLSNRALVAAGLARGSSRLAGLLVADDTDAMVACLARLGATIADVGGSDPASGSSRPINRTLDVGGLAGQLPTPTTDGGSLDGGSLDAGSLDAGLSGTVSRFLVPVLALGPGPYRLDGLPPLRRRPMGPLIDAVRTLGATVDEVGEPGYLPLVVGGGRSRLGDRVAVRGDLSSQFVTALMLVGPCLPAGLHLVIEGARVSAPYLDMTASIMEHFGARCERVDDGYVIAAGGYRAADLAVEPDASSASYFFAAAVIGGGSVRVDGLGRQSLQGDLRFVDVLGQMGAVVVDDGDATEVRAGDRLSGIDVDLGAMPDMATTLATVAVFADGPTRVRNVGIIRGHETDRIAAVVTELRRCGIEAHEHDDGFEVVPGAPQPAVIQTYDDHRMAMSFALLGLAADGIAIADPGCVAKTFPGYFAALDRLRVPSPGGATHG